MSASRFQRMVGVPEDEYEHLKSLQKIGDPLQDKFMDLSKEYRQQGFISNPQVRVQRQGETLNQMVTIKDELRKRLTLFTPKPYQSRAHGLFDFISGRIGMTDKGEIYDSAGSLVKDSNISDLIQHAVRDRRRSITPTGWHAFLDILRDSNAPRMILNYETLGEMQGRKPTTPAAAIKRPSRSRTPVSVKKFRPPALKGIGKSRSPSSAAVSPRRLRTRIKREPSTTSYLNVGGRTGQAKKRGGKYI